MDTDARGCLVAQASSMGLWRRGTEDFPLQRRKVAEENISVMKFLQAVATLVLRARPETGGFHFQNQHLPVVIASEATQSKKRLINRSPLVHYPTDSRDDHLRHVRPNLMDAINSLRQNIFFNHEVYEGYEEKRRFKNLCDLCAFVVVNHFCLAELRNPIAASSRSPYPGLGKRHHALAIIFHRKREHD